MIFPYNFIVLFILAFLFLFTCIICYRKDLIIKKHLIYIFIAILISAYIIHIESSIINIKQNITNIDNDMTWIKEQIIDYSILN